MHIKVVFTSVVCGVHTHFLVHTTFSSRCSPSISLAFYRIAFYTSVSRFSTLDFHDVNFRPPFAKDAFIWFYALFISFCTKLLCQPKLFNMRGRTWILDARQKLNCFIFSTVKLLKWLQERCLPEEQKKEVKIDNIWLLRKQFLKSLN